MKPKIIPFTKEELNEIFIYNPTFGCLLWRKSVGCKIKAHSKAGCFNKSTGYIEVQIQGAKYKIHRIIYKMLAESFNESFDIDHRNENKIDNKMENFRLVTRQENCFNKKAKGCFYNKRLKKWQAQIGVNWKRIHLGVFNTESEAMEAYLTAKKEYHHIKSHA